MSSDESVAARPPARSRFWWAKWVAGAIVLIVLAVEGYLIWPKLEEAWQRVGELNWFWVFLCIVASMLSMDSFAQVQRALLRSAGVRVAQMQSLAVVLAANSLSATMPGGQVLAPAFTYRETRKWGATPVVASWQVVMSGLLAAVGLAVLGVVGAMMGAAQTSPYSVMFSLLGFVAVVVVLQYLSSHPESLRAIALKTLEWVNRIRKKPADDGARKVLATLEQLRAVQLTRRDGSFAFGWSLFNWVADVAALGFACYAVQGYPSIPGLMVAYAASKAVGTAIPLLPGGIGVVDAVLSSALVTAGMPLSDAILAVLVYRLISFVLVAVIGWVVILFRYRDSFRNAEPMDDEVENYLADERSRSEAATESAYDAAHDAASAAEDSEVGVTIDDPDSPTDERSDDPPPR